MSEAEMKYINAVHDLLIAFSDLPLGDYESSLELPYIIYGECFAPYIRKMITGNDRKELKHIFSFLEEMAKSEDEDTRDLLQVAILETFWADKAMFSFLKKYMHPHTREIFNSIGEYLFSP